MHTIYYYIIKRSFLFWYPILDLPAAESVEELRCQSPESKSMVAAAAEDACQNMSKCHHDKAIYHVGVENVGLWDPSKVFHFSQWSSDWEISRHEDGTNIRCIACSIIDQEAAAPLRDQLSRLQSEVSELQGRFAQEALTCEASWRCET